MYTVNRALTQWEVIKRGINATAWLLSEVFEDFFYMVRMPHHKKSNLVYPVQIQACTDLFINQTKQPSNKHMAQHGEDLFLFLTWVLMLSGTMLQMGDDG